MKKAQSYIRAYKLMEPPVLESALIYVIDKARSEPLQELVDYMDEHSMSFTPVYQKAKKLLEELK
jgi:hypothetical protein